MTSSQQVNKTLYYRIYPTYLQGTREQLKKVNKHSFYRISVWQGDKQLGEMIEGASPAILVDKIYLTKALINFSQQLSGGNLTFKLHQHDQEDTELGSGIFSLEPIKKKYAEQGQRYHSQQQALLITTTGPLRLIFSIFVENSKHELEQYVRRNRQNQKNVMRARRNINQYKREVLIKAAVKEKQASRSRTMSSKKKLSDIKQTKNESGIEKEDENYQEGLDNFESEGQDTLSRRQQWNNVNKSYLEIDSAVKLHTKVFYKTAPAFRKNVSTPDKFFQPGSTLAGDSTIGTRYLVSSLDVATMSLISDGSEQSQMRMNNENQTYSQRAIKNFKSNTANLFNILLIVLAVSLVYVMISPSSKFSKLPKIKSFRR